MGIIYIYIYIIIIYYILYIIIYIIHYIYIYIIHYIYTRFYFFSLLDYDVLETSKRRVMLYNILSQ